MIDLMALTVTPKWPKPLSRLFSHFTASLRRVIDVEASRLVFRVTALRVSLLK